MKRTTDEGNIANRYTDGNPTTGVPSTIVSAEMLNQFQGELSNLVEGAGIVLDGNDETQVLQAVKAINLQGGDQVNFVVADNVASAANVAGLLFNKADVKAVRIFFDIFRRDDTQSANETGELFISHDTEADDWNIFLASHGADAGVSFSITSSGQVQYTSTSYAGTSYTGTAKFTAINTIAQ